VTLSLANKRFRHTLIAAIAVLGVALSILVSLSSYDKNEKIRRDQFNNAVENRYLALKKEIDVNLHVLETLQDLFYATQDLERSRVEFRDFAKQILKNHPSIQALQWIPRVPNFERKSYESAARQDGFPDFQFTERLSSGKMRRAEQRKEYFPLYFVEPSLGNTDLGFDVASDAVRWPAMERAAKSGEMLATGRIALSGEIGNQFGFIIFAPVYHKGGATNTDLARQDNLEGFMQSEFRINDIVEVATGLLGPVGVDFSINDASASAEKRFLYLHESRLRKTPLVIKSQTEAGFRKTKTLEVAGRQWTISYSATPDFIAAGDNLHEWGLLLAGFAVTGLVTGFLFFSSKHAEQIEKSARELSNANAMLMQEIMEHQQTEDQLREKERLLSESQRLGHIGSFLYDMTGPIQWSDELYRLYGVSPETFTPTLESLLGLMHPDDRTLMQDWTAACKAGEKPDPLVSRIHMPDGTVRFIKGWGDVVHDEENRVSYITGMAQDITDLKQAEEKIRKQRELTTKIIETIPLRVFWKDRDLRFLGGNTLFAKDAGVTRPEELIGKTDFEMPWKDQAEMYRADDQPVMDANTPKLSYDELQTTPEGRQIWLRTSKVPLHNDRNEIIGILGVYEDITVHKQAEEALRRYSDELEKNNKALQEALAKVKQLTGMLPICASCKRIKGDKGDWCGVETYMSEHTDAVFSHGLCPECEKKEHEDLAQLIRDNS